MLGGRNIITKRAKGIYLHFSIAYWNVYRQYGVLLKTKSEKIKSGPGLEGLEPMAGEVIETQISTG